MWHKVETVAEHNRLNVEELVKFAEDNADAFNIINEFGYPEVSTWYVNDLVNQFKWMKEI